MNTDTITNDIAARIATLPYIEKSFGRAMIFNERWGEKGLTRVPKVHIGNGEYEMVLPNDKYTTQSYIIAVTHEGYDTFDRMQMGGINRQFAIVFWGKLGDPAPNTLEEIKVDFINILQKISNVASIDDYADETYTQVFPEFSDYINNARRNTQDFEADTQWLMFPHTGFRLLFTVNYTQECK